MRLHITKAEIETAVPGDPHHCAIADAVRVAVPNALSIKVDRHFIQWSDPVLRQRFKAVTPPGAVDLLLAFDQLEPVKPRTITLTHIKSIPMGWQAQNNRSVSDADRQTVYPQPTTVASRKRKPRSKRAVPARRVRIAGECRMVPR